MPGERAPSEADYLEGTVSRTDGRADGAYALCKILVLAYLLRTVTATLQ